ncbi:hypothetical protein TRFO_11950 [Tritrichomonas foetus]|uniref:Uncharacterized protein n=1 Tax=Tritrichomonas foetus TaxID=1144522 RepID=A0A1J4J7V9_9EUKA|nr:hypothetical protein TRFO_11950 [Tritrichomonas foetus]|eukprot:OHS93316.1 hypothetical protein TRFO_11950 [Tritrichomonas foetus]
MEESAIPPINIPSQPRNAVTRPNTVRNASTRRRHQSARAQTQRSAYQKALIQAKLYAGCNFGKDAKKITIGMSRPEPKQSIFMPGPGAYDPPRQPLSHRFRTAISNYYPEKDFSTLTSEIDYRSERQFPETRPMTVGTRPNRALWDVINSPPPNYINKRPFADVPSHKIQSRHGVAKIEPFPGPGTYDPTPVNEFVHTTHLVMGNERRGHWMVNENNPSPADYSPEKKNILVKEPGFTIGSKSRRNKRRERNQSPKKATIGIDVFLVKIDPSINEAEAREYVKSHPDLKYVLHEVIEEILEKKPAAPVGYMRDYFIEKKKEMGIADPEPEEDPLEYYKSL